MLIGSVRMRKREMDGRINVEFLQIVNFLILFAACFSFDFDATEASKCDTCKDLTRRFDEGLEKTANSNFGGGNTHWEEKKLGSFTFSETRLIEIMEYSCLDGTKECHHMLEENEEVLEHWWFNLFAKGQDKDLNKYLCLDLLKVCCPEGTFGPDCQECPTGKSSPCSGHGTCEGSGTREGTGRCSCHPGYLGELCNECSDSRYFEEVKNETHTICTACHFSCKMTCHGPGAAMCDDCIYGWSFVEGQGCIECDTACNGCTGNGAENCIECRQKYFHDGNACRACHVSCASNCSDDSARSCDECATGWRLNEEESECQDINECSQESTGCSSNSFCVNSEGSFSCPKCDKTCDGCSGPTNKDCKECQTGYAKNEENECHDVDECHTVEGVCSGTGERCVNRLGSYKCECEKGFVRISGKCEVKRKGDGKKKKTKEENKISENITPESKLPEFSPDSFADDVKKLGKPVEGVKIDDQEEEMVVMGGNFETPKQDRSNIETIDSKESTDTKYKSNEHDDL